MAKSKLIQANEKIADAVVSGYKKIEDGVAGAYKKVEDGFVDQFLTHEGETVEDAKKRLAEAQAQRKAAAAQTDAPPGITFSPVSGSSAQQRKSVKKLRSVSS